MSISSFCIEQREKEKEALKKYLIYSLVGSAAFHVAMVFSVSWGQFSGKDCREYANKNRYEGEFSNGKLSGQGTYTFADRNSYKGAFKDGKFNGTGVYTFANGDSQALLQ